VQVGEDGTLVQPTIHLTVAAEGMRGDARPRRNEGGGGRGCSDTFLHEQAQALE